ncbi:response regulators consisting of a CheY-like receiver domain and a winged-helix DNA-binding domain [Anaerolinea thermolimosa]|nr:response regulator transcription factor [Anaerolinea thermolimosa]GAP06281.1 response regulators consisting of a CheY-like receiver domain and a winged-helix DNA-binding domain [Anaerolinea thermolimosa]
MAKILVVDDEEIARTSLADILRLEGHEIKAVSSGEQAVQVLESEPFDVMLLDLRMPGMGGIDVLRAVVDRLQSLQVIVLTAHGSLDSAIQALRFRVHDYMLKPVSPEQIIASIEKALDARRAGDSGGSSHSRKTNLFSLPGGTTLDLAKRVVCWKEGEINLTPTEARLLGILMTHLGEVIPHSELVKHCQGYHVDNEEAARILRPVVSRLRQKMTLIPGWGEWIKNVRGSGYMIEFPHDQS